MSLFKKKNENDVCYDTADVKSSTVYWRYKLLAYCLNLFEYIGLPESLPPREIESNLILTGHCVIFPRDGEIVTCKTELYGFDKYYNPTSAVYSQPVLKSGNVRLDMDYATIIYNSVLNEQVLGEYVDGGLNMFISRYARMFADIESTFSIDTVNKRMPFMPTAKDSATAESVFDFYEKVALGHRTIVSDDYILPDLKMVDTGVNSNKSEKLIDYLYTRDKLFECFMREIGIIYYQTKRAQVNVAEVNVNNDMCMYLIDDMLKSRENGIEELNRKFNLNVSVHINDRIASMQREKGGTYDGE